MIRKSLVTLLGMSLLRSIAWADAPLTTFHLSSEKVSPLVRKDAIGAIRIDAEVVDVEAFERVAGKFQSKGKIRLDHTHPLTTFGYHPSESELMAAYFPITNIEQNHVEIIIDCETNKRVWINDSAVKSNRILFNKFDLTVEPGLYVDPFYFQKEKIVNVYPTSDASQAPILLKANLESYEGMNLQPKRFKVIDQRGGLLNIEGVGWLKIRDASGLLVIWPGQDSMSGYSR